MLRLATPIRSLALGALLLAVAGGAAAREHPAAAAPLFAIPDSELPRPLTFIAYGDIRFTDPAEIAASSPGVRRALIARIAVERPAALFVSGDLPWHGGTIADYDVYRAETAVWRENGLRVFPALGNHEFAGCEEQQCLANWWSAFPELSGRRWYAVALGSLVHALVLDSDASLEVGSPQRAWLEAEFRSLPRSVRFVVLCMHHPPLADLASGELADHNPRPNEMALADYLGGRAATSRARIVVVAGHIHNYERLERDGVVYLVAGGGGAKPYPVERSSADRFHGREAVNYHFIRFRLDDGRLSAEMVRLADADAGRPGRFEVADRFELRSR